LDLEEVRDARLLGAVEPHLDVGVGDGPLELPQDGRGVVVEVDDAGLCRR
jgi:hypothetical protein